MNNKQPPPDISRRAHRLARYVDRLPDGEAYVIRVDKKSQGVWAIRVQREVEVREEWKVR